MRKGIEYTGVFNKNGFALCFYFLPSVNYFCLSGKMNVLILGWMVFSWRMEW